MQRCKTYARTVEHDRNTRTLTALPDDVSCGRARAAFHGHACVNICFHAIATPVALSSISHFSPSVMRRSFLRLALLAAVACTPSTHGVQAPTPLPPPTTFPPATALGAGALSPDAPLASEQRRWVDSTLASLSLRQRVGQMVNVWVLGDYTNERDSSFAEVVRWVTEDGVGGMTMSLGSPIEVAAKVNVLQARARVPLLVASDLEPGLGRLEGGIFAPYMLVGGSATVFPNAMAIGATGDDSLAYRAAYIIGREARAVGIQVVFGPVADVNNNPSNPVINTRSFGESPSEVALHGLTYTDALTMEAVGEGYTVERSAVLAVQAGADMLVKPSDTRRTKGRTCARGRVQGASSRRANVPNLPEERPGRARLDRPQCRWSRRNRHHHARSHDRGHRPLRRRAAGHAMDRLTGDEGARGRDREREPIRDQAVSQSEKLHGDIRSRRCVGARRGSGGSWRGVN